MYMTQSTVNIACDPAADLTGTVCVACCGIAGAAVRGALSLPTDDVCEASCSGFGPLDPVFATAPALTIRSAPGALGKVVAVNCSPPPGLETAFAAELLQLLASKVGRTRQAPDPRRPRSPPARPSPGPRPHGPCPRGPPQNAPQTAPRPRRPPPPTRSAGTTLPRRAGGLLPRAGPSSYRTGDCPPGSPSSIPWGALSCPTACRGAPQRRRWATR